jgi:hypothetical protein
LQLYGTAHGSVYAIEDNQQRVARCLDDPAAMPLSGRIDQVGTESTQALKGTQVIQADQTAVTNHVGIDHGDQLPPIR